MKNKVFYVRAKLLDIEVGDRLKVLLNEGEAWKFGITAIDKVTLLYKDNGEEKELVVDADLTNDLVKQGFVGITKDIYEQYKINKNDLIGVYYTKSNPLSIQAIKKKLLGKKLHKEEIYALIKDMNDGRLSDILATYYAACSFAYKTDKTELFWAAKYSAELGDMIKFKKSTYVKYCIGGVPGNETTLAIVPILASLGVCSPKTFSRAITSPAATGECTEVLMNVSFKADDMMKIVENVNACLILGNILKFAPANDQIIRVSYPLSMEAYSKMLVSIIAKIYAGGAKHCLIDIPYGGDSKVSKYKVARKIKSRFEYIGNRLGIKMEVVLTNGKMPIGKGIGAVLQVREVLRILEQHPERSKDLEAKIINLGAKLLKLNPKFKNSEVKKIIINQIKKGLALEQLKKIADFQNGIKKSEPDYDKVKYLGVINSEDLPLAKMEIKVKSEKNGVVNSINLKRLKGIALVLGCPIDKQAGIYLNKQIGEKVKKGEILFTIYGNTKRKISDANELVELNDLYNIV